MDISSFNVVFNVMWYSRTRHRLLMYKYVYSEHDSVQYIRDQLHFHHSMWKRAFYVHEEQFFSMPCSRSLPAQNTNINTVNTGPIKLFIDEEKRIFNEEIHYFDHPYFGAIVSIKKI